MRKKPETRPRRPIPPPPSRDADYFTFEEAAGYLRVRRRAIDEFRRNDPTFPKPILLSPGAPRIRRVDLDAWVATRPRGWSTMGGLRERAFGKE